LTAVCWWVYDELDTQRDLLTGILRRTSVVSNRLNQVVPTLSPGPGS
jgi:hypothetical protein